MLSEGITDLGNDLLSCNDWSPNESQSPHASELKKPTSIDTSTPFGQALPAAVVVNPDSWSRIDAHINGIINVGLLGGNWRGLGGAALLDLHIFGRPADDNEPIPRDDLVAMKKILSEDSLSEVKEVLGWIINTRDFTVSFPDKKFKEWSDQIIRILKANKSDPS